MARTSEGISPWTWAALFGGLAAAVWAARSASSGASGAETPSERKEEDVPDFASDKNPPGSAPMNVPLLPDGGSLVLFGDDLVLDLQPSMDVAAAQHHWQMGIASVAGGTISSLLEATNTLVIPKSDVIVCSVGTFDARGVQNPAVREGVDMVGLVTTLRAKASRGLVFVIPPSFHRYLLWPDEGEWETYGLLREVTRLDGPFGPRANIYGVFPSFGTNKPELAEDGFRLAPAGGALVANELVDFLTAT